VAGKLRPPVPQQPAARSWADPAARPFLDTHRSPRRVLEVTFFPALFIAKPLLTYYCGGMVRARGAATARAHPTRRPC
jgi:hypothetical protein